MSENRSSIGCGTLLLLGAAALLGLAAFLALSSNELTVFVLGVSSLGALIVWSTIMITAAISDSAKKSGQQ